MAPAGAIFNLNLAVGRCRVCGFRGAGQGATTRNGCSIPRSCNAVLCREKRAICFVAGFATKVNRLFGRKPFPANGLALQTSGQLPDLGLMLFVVELRLIGRVLPGNTIFLGGPLAEVDQLAAARAERPVFIGCRPFGGFLAHRAGNGADFFCSLGNVACSRSDYAREIAAPMVKHLHLEWAVSLRQKYPLAARIEEPKTCCKLVHDCTNMGFCCKPTISEKILVVVFKGKNKAGMEPAKGCLRLLNQQGELRCK